MTKPAPAPPLDWTHTTTEIAPKGLDIERHATAAELAACAQYLDILGVDRLVVSYRIKPLSGGRYSLSGKLEADVVQACVVSLDPVPATLNDAFEAEFRPGAAEPETADDEEIEALSATEFEPIENHRLDAGRIIVETLLAALPAYPRAPGAELESTEAVPPAAASTSPFAKLAALKPKDK